MPRFLTLVNFTDQGMRAIKDSAGRADTFRNAAQSAGAEVESLFWSLGEFDGAFVLNAPDEETAAALVIALNRLGNVRTRTQRLYDAEEMTAIIAKLPGS